MKDSRSWWQRMWRRATPRREAPAPPREAPSEPPELPAVAFLSELVDALAQGQRRDEAAGAPVMSRLEELWRGGHERLAIEWTEKLIAVPGLPEPTVLALRAAVVERYDQRRELEQALVHLEVLAGHQAHAVRAHYLLAEHFRKLGDEVSALRHYEAVLGRDLAYPNVRVRAERLRQSLGRSAPSTAETIAGVQVVGVQAGARYRLVRELGRGATGVVYLTRDAELERDVAVKLLHPHLASTESSGALAQFFHEARVMASLRHPNIVAVLDLDETSRRIVMELAGGGTLRELLRERGPRPLRRSIERHVQVLSALSAAHRRGIIHRDLKPGNLMFRRDPDLPGVEVMLGDFGIAHLPNAEPGAGKKADAAGTLAYMAPEQRRGEAVPASDLFAAAVVFFEMVTARTPWPREQILSGKRARDDLRLPPEVTAAAPAVAADLQSHLLALGDPDPAQRPTTADALATAQRLRERIVAQTARAAG
ncbi:MAG: serine/threonine protein kinase [Myxococcales bacterium]|nr:serine/threonine protein kinase [Myxococcales bacterium]